jgi:hypothetical protein
MLSFGKPGPPAQDNDPLSNHLPNTAASFRHWYR